MGPFGQMQSGGRERAGERVESLARGLGSPERRRARAGLLALLGQRGASGLGRQGRKGAGRGTEKETGHGEEKLGHGAGLGCTELGRFPGFRPGYCFPISFLFPFLSQTKLKLFEFK